MKTHRIAMIVFLLALAISSYAQTELSGPVQGTLPAGEYIVVDNLVVPSGTSLYVQPGTTFRFREGVDFDMYGRLLAEGSAQDSIYFIPEHPGGTWGGLNYHDLSGYHQLLHSCVIEGSVSSGVSTEEILTLHIAHCRFSHNSATEFGGAIVSFLLTSYSIDSSEFSFNQDYAICFYDGAEPIVCNDLYIHDNQGGVCLIASPATLSHCRIVNNSSDMDGGGIHNEYSVRVEYCLIAGNSSHGNGGGIFDMNGGVIHNCTVVHNSCDGEGAGIYQGGIEDCVGCIFAYNHGSYSYYYSILNGLYSRVYYNLFYGNDGQDLGDYRSSDTTFVQLTRTNGNGDSCDAHFNLFLDPRFADPENDYHLLPDSPCIDAGDPWQSDDPDGTVRDMGAFPTGTTSFVGGEEPPILPPSRVTLFPVYPNPFNLTTTIPFVLPATEQVQLVVCNVLGREVANLVNGMREAGRHEVNWNGLDDGGQGLGSGIYFVTLRATDITATRKVVLLK